MPRARKPVPKDPPTLIAMRERLKPPDYFRVEAPDEYLREWALGWVNSTPTALSRAKAQKGWVEVTRDEPVKAPGAYGDKTDNFLHHGDLILCKRPRELKEAEDAGKALFHRYQLEGMMHQSAETAERLGAHIDEHEVRIGEGAKEEVIRI